MSPKNQQKQSGKPSSDIIARMVQYEVVSDGPRFTVAGYKGRRAGEIGTVVGILSLKHVPGYEVVLRFSDNKTDSFNPYQLFPVN